MNNDVWHGMCCIVLRGKHDKLDILKWEDLYKSHFDSLPAPKLFNCLNRLNEQSLHQTFYTEDITVIKFTGT